MCDPVALMNLLVAAQTAYLATMALVGAAVVTSSNPFTSGGSPVLLGAALVALGVSVGAIGAAASRVGPCTTGRCGDLGSELMAAFVALNIMLVAVSAATAATIVPSAIPFAGSIIAGVLLTSIIVSALLFWNALRVLNQLIACRAIPSPRRPQWPES